jgi:DNA repair ATPase RecN
LQGKQLAWEFINEEALTSNEQLKLSQEYFYQKLSHIQKFNKTMNDFLNIIKDKMSEIKHVQDAFEKVKNWQEKYKSAPDNIARISSWKNSKFKSLWTVGYKN